MKPRPSILCGLLAAALLPGTRAPAQQIIVLHGDTTVTTTTRRRTVVSPDADKANGQPAETSPEPPLPATLFWNNGESAPGDPVGATAESLLWKSPLFDDPLELAWSALHRVDKVLPDSTPVDAFAFVLRDGSRLYGDLTGVSPTTVNIHSARHGDAALRRSEVLGAWRIKGKGLVYGGPLGESGWTAVANVRLDNEGTSLTDTLGKVPTRATGPGGSLVLPFWHRTLTNAITLPDRAEVEFELHAKDVPEFQLVFDTRAKKRLRIETWGNEIVLATTKGFQKIGELGENDRRAALRLCWDIPAGRCQVYSPAGALLTEWTVPDGSEGGGGKPAVYLLNKGRELSLDRLRVREWDGKPLTAADAQGLCITLADGRVVPGSVSGIEGDTVAVAPPGGGEAVSVSLTEVDALVFAEGTPADAPHDTTLACADGTLLRGQITGFQDGRALLRTAFTESPLAVKIDDLRQLLVQSPAPAGTPPEPALETLDKIVVQGTTLHGHLVAATDGDTPRWMPVGGRNAVTPARSAISEITRVLPTGAEAPPATSLLYTRLGDALPGVLHGLDRKEVEFDSPWIETKTLPASELQAVQFDAAGKGAIGGFDAGGWQVVKGDKAEIQPDGNSLKLTPGAVFGHPGAAQAGEVKFTYDTEMYSSLRIRLFCEGTSGSRSLNYILMRSGNRMSSGVETAEGQFSNQRQTVTTSGPVSVRLVIDDKAVRCYLANTLVETVWYPASKRAGAGLLLESCSLWGNAPQPLALSKFSASSPTGRSFLVSVNTDAKTQALTIPRFRKDDPPRHALLASNGDVLRGEIVALTNTQIGFRIGLETLRIPRERVAAVIALQPPAPAPPVPSEADATQKLLERHVGLNTWYTNVGFNTLLSVMRQAVPELKFQTPNDPDTVHVQFRFENQTVGDVLDSLCEQFDLRYRVEKGVIVLEARAQRTDANLVRKAYWLKTNPFAGHGAARDVLAARDVPFPKGSSVEWQESSQCLEMVNTAANQQKVAGLLANELGGTLGSPTHWLLLRNGGRIGLVVEKFEPDAVRGTHPLYGHCKIPLADIYAVRNTLPEPTEAARAVSGWRLVDAAEPVLPESGGESSDLLGKDAPIFKLKTLDGNEFDLGQQKGSVVVLDFWATWCGPCIKSLPGLIDVMSQFPADKVKLVGLNQAEAPEQVKRFLSAHQWKLDVVLDASQRVAKQYGVDGIPHTVIVGPDGKVAWVQTGATPDGDEQAGATVKKLLGASTNGAQEKGKPEDAK